MHPAAGYVTGEPNHAEYSDEIMRLLSIKNKFRLSIIGRTQRVPMGLPTTKAIEHENAQAGRLHGRKKMLEWRMKC